MIAEIIIMIIAVSAVVMLLSPITIHVNSSRRSGMIDGILSLSWIILNASFVLKDRRTEILVLGKRVMRLSPEKKKPQPKPKQSRKIPPASDVLNAVRPMLRFLKDLFHSFSIKYLNLNFTFGLGDPAYTGILTGFLYALNGSFPTGGNIRWNADFTRQVLEWDLNVKAAVTPVMLLPPFVRFFMDRKTREIFRASIFQ
jgi:hypothetical protein